VTRQLGQLLRDASGATVVEFALIAPLLLLLYLGGYGLSDAIACNRKVTTTARSVADLVSRSSAVSESYVSTALGASSQVMAPYKISSALVRVSEVKVTGTTTAQVIWSRATGGTALTTGASVAMPSGMASTGSYMILGEVSYTYVPVEAWGASQAMTLSDRVFMSPRLSDQVPLS